MRLARLVVLFAVAALVFPAGSAAAGPAPAALDLVTDQGPDELTPGGEPGTWNWTLTYHATAPPATSVTVYLEPEADAVWHSGGSVSVEPRTVTFEIGEGGSEGPSPLSRTYTANGTLSIAAGEHAPAFRATGFELKASTDGDTVSRHAETRTQVTAVADWRPGLEVEAEESSVTVPGGETVHVRANLRNVGNGLSQITYDRFEAPDGCQVDPLHEEITLGAFHRRDAVVHLACKEGASDGELTVTYAQTYAPDTSEETIRVDHRWQVDVEGSPTVEAQAAVLGTSANVAGVPISALALLSIAGSIVLRRFGDDGQ